MPLLPLTLQNELRRFTDMASPTFEAFPVGAQETAQRWAGAVRAYFLEMITPTILPGIHSAAEQAMIGSMVGLIQPVPGVAAAALTAGLAAFTGVLVGGAAPPQVVVPPPAPFVAPPFPPTTDGLTAALTMALTIDLWARTGTWAIPPAAPAPWA